MKEQLKLLEELQRFDAKIQELDGQRLAIPARLEEMRANLTKVQDLVSKAREELEQTEKWRRDQETDVKTDAEQLIKARAKVNLVKTSKEYMSSQREVETTRRLAAEAEEKLLKVMEAADAARARIATQEADIARLREVVNKEEREAQGRLRELEAGLAEARVHRDAAAKRVRADVLKRYGVIRMKRGLAVVAVKNGSCTGCHMNIPPQLYNTLQRGNSLELCPACHRIIYWDKLMDETDGRPTESA